ncbi:MAG: hypothetical protein KJ950_09730 [Proteobacteria bacterium]|nr:hypothetical protein [Pseudomonadota bacterium]MBU1688934.1 hypothetical protein [Pseudomonadota bacterium]
MKSIKRKIVTILNVLILLSFAGCGGGTGNLSYETGSASLSLLWEDSSGLMITTRAASNPSLVPDGVVTVRVIFSSPGRSNVQQDFPVDAGSGLVEGIPVANNWTVTVRGLKADMATVLYEGVRNGITITSGENNIGIVTMVSVQNQNDVDNDGDGYAESRGDCNDSDSSINPVAIEICGDGIDQNCSGSDMVCSADSNASDDDWDGYSENQGDCDDTNGTVYPGAPEACGDGIDQDCSGADLVCSADPNEIDDDRDGFNENQGDCDDFNNSVHPGAMEVCGDGIDQDCQNGDMICLAIDFDGDGYTDGQGDCNDGDSTIYPGAIDIPNDGIDQDCSGADATTGGSVGTVTSPTGRVWLDRNLGAARVATSFDDSEAYGDLYLWGRDTDGHEKRNSPTTTTLSSSDTPGHGSFILAPSDPYDWRSPQNNNLWQGMSGVNNPCPAGFRLPTDMEWEAERVTWSSNDQNGAFASPLKLVSAGYRHFNGSVDYAGSNGNYWSSSVNGIFARNLHFRSGNAYISNGYNRATGFSVRCLED